MRILAAVLVLTYVLAVRASDPVEACLRSESEYIERIVPLRGTIVMSRSDLGYRERRIQTEGHVRLTRHPLTRFLDRIDYEADAGTVLVVGRTRYTLSSDARVTRPRAAALARTDNGRCNQVEVILDQPVAALRVRVTQAGHTDEVWHVEHAWERRTTYWTQPICPTSGSTALELFVILDDGREHPLNGRVDYASIPIRVIEGDESDTDWELDLAVSRAALLALLALLFAHLALPRVAIGDRSLRGHRWSVLFRRPLPRARVVQCRIARRTSQR